MKFLILFICIYSPSLMAKSLDRWVEAQSKQSFEYLLDNISRKDTRRGIIVASPSKEDPNYYFHWVRDAALVMRAVDRYLPDNKTKADLFTDYIELVRYIQNVNSYTGLGEPKYNPDGSSYKGPWGRPQNDGPALRAITLIHYANKLIRNGQKDLVSESLYSLKNPEKSVIKKDLEYVSHNWRNADFDLWEEVKGTHFYTRMAQRSALYLGADLAIEMGDKFAAEWYLMQAKKINVELDRHWSAEKGYILATINWVDGLSYKHSNLDSSVILAVNHAWLPGLSFGPTDPRVFKTYQAIANAFKNIYPINKTGPGVAIGRYPEDQYYSGNPWFLLTNAIAEYLFTIGNNSEAQSFLERIKMHIDRDGRMSEQYSKANGYMLGARDLTWSYASVLTIKTYGN